MATATYTFQGTAIFNVPLVFSSGVLPTSADRITQISGSVTVTMESQQGGFGANGLQINLLAVAYKFSPSAGTHTISFNSQIRKNSGASLPHPWGSNVIVYVFPRFGLRVTATTHSVTLTLTHEPKGDDGGPRPEPKPRPQPNRETSLIFSTQPAVLLNVGSDITTVVDEVSVVGGQRDLSKRGTTTLTTVNSLSGQVVENSFAATSSTGTTMTKLSGNMVDGRLPYTLQLNSGVLTEGSQYRFKAEKGSKSILSNQWTLGTNIPLIDRLRFSTQPTSPVEIGETFSSFAVQALTATGGVETTFGDNISISILNPDDSVPPGVLAGNTVVAATAGTSTYTDISYSDPGGYKLKAETGTGTTLRRCYSNALTITGLPTVDDFSGLRQNIRDDGTLVFRTTNITSPTIVTASSGNKSIIDGDMASTSFVTTDGFRFVFPFRLKLKRIRTKFIVSTLTGDPYVSIYVSSDTTTGSNGTWTLISSFIPKNLENIRVFDFATPQYCKGVWVTLNDNGGAATCNWQAIHIVGPYIGPSVSYVDVTSQDDVRNEETVVIPSDGRNLFGARTVTRDMLIRNNTNAEIFTGMIPTAARNGGDTKMTSSNIFVLDPDTNQPIQPFALPAHSSKRFQLQYTILEADNNLSGQHLARISLGDPRNDGYFLPIDAEAGGTQAYASRKFSDGSALITKNVGFNVETGCVDWARNEVFIARTSAHPYTIEVYDYETGSALRTLTVTDPDLTSPSMGDMTFANDRLYIISAGGASQSRLTVADAQTGVYIAGTACGGSSATRDICHNQYGEIYCSWNQGSGDDEIAHINADGTVLFELTLNDATNSSIFYWDQTTDQLVWNEPNTNQIVFRRYNRTLNTLISTTTVDFNAVFGLTLSGNVFGAVDAINNREWLFVSISGTDNDRAYYCTPGDYANLTFSHTVTWSIASSKPIKNIKSVLRSL